MSSARSGKGRSEGTTTNTMMPPHVISNANTDRRHKFIEKKGTPRQTRKEKKVTKKEQENRKFRPRSPVAGSKGTLGHLNLNLTLGIPLKNTNTWFTENKPPVVIKPVGNIYTDDQKNYSMTISKSLNKVNIRVFVKDLLFQKVKFWVPSDYAQFVFTGKTVCSWYYWKHNMTPQTHPIEYWKSTAKAMGRMHADHRNNVIKAIKKTYYGRTKMLLSVAYIFTHFLFIFCTI